MLDDIFAFLLGLIALAVAPLVTPAILVINLVAQLIEWFLGLFMEGITIGKITRKKKDDPKKKTTIVVGAWVIWGGILFLLIYSIAWPKLSQRELKFMTTDGRPVMMALIEFENDGSIDHLRTDSVGNITVPRFGLDRVSMKDSRYVEKYWRGDDIEGELVVVPTLLGAGLDSLKDQFLKPFKGGKE